MINHSVQSLSLAEFDEGEISIPNEAGSVVFPANLRQFILLTRRAYNENALISNSDEEGIKIRSYSEEKGEETTPYFGLTLKFKPIADSIPDFIEENGDAFFDSIIGAVSVSSKRKMSGERACFVREFRIVEDDNFGEVLETKILVSTSIFFNDYRVTTGYPSTEIELDDEVTRLIFDKLSTEWCDQINLSIEASWNPYEDEV